MYILQRNIIYPPQTTAETSKSAPKWSDVSIFLMNFWQKVYADIGIHHLDKKKMINELRII